MSRRAVFALAAGSVLGITACGPVRVGGPAEYTPPPPGIDDLYRVDLLALLDRTVASTEALRDRADAGTGASDGGGEPAPAPPDVGVTDALAALSRALPVQREALLTGAQAERESEQAEDPDPHATTAPAPTATATDLAGLIALLVELRELCVDAARQVSGSLARPVCALGAHTAWAAARLNRASGQGEVPGPRVAEDIAPARAVPQQDPPSIGAESDYHQYIEAAQEQEWYTAYVHEVLAASAEGTAREDHLTAVEEHRARADALLTIAKEDGAPPVERQAVYPLPGGTLSGRSAAQLPSLLSEALLVGHVSLVGAAPFERRAVSIEAAMAEAGVLASLVGRLEPLPSLAPEGAAEE